VVNLRAVSWTLGTTSIWTSWALPGLWSEFQTLMLAKIRPKTANASIVAASPRTSGRRRKVTEHLIIDRTCWSLPGILLSFVLLVTVSLPAFRLSCELPSLQHHERAQVSIEEHAGKLEGFKGGLRAFPRLVKPWWRRHKVERGRDATRRNGE
jgi:hypothetical protein